MSPNKSEWNWKQQREEEKPTSTVVLIRDTIVLFEHQNRDVVCVSLTIYLLQQLTHILKINTNHMTPVFDTKIWCQKIVSLKAKQS